MNRISETSEYFTHSTTSKRGGDQIAMFNSNIRKNKKLILFQIK